MTDLRNHAYGATHIGHKRKRNEDRFLVKHLKSGLTLLAVADGMGGEAGGDIAAEIVTATLDDFDFGSDPAAEKMSEALHQAEQRIKERKAGQAELEGMGATATVALAGDKRIIWAHSGDSRLYRLQSGNLDQVTRDHTFLQDLVDDGTMSRAEAKQHPLRNMLDQCVGCGDLKPDSGVFAVGTGDRLLLCSDGLTKHVEDDQIGATMKSATVREAVEALVRLALEGGGKDNVTVVAWENTA